MVEKHNSNSIILTCLNFVEDRLGYFARNSILSLIIIGVIAFFLRWYYFPHNIPITLDGLTYFFYATDLSISGQFPKGYEFPNNGWPTFLSIFFTIFHFDNYLSYMTLQRIISLSISVLTIIPVYLLCNRFFDKRLALVGATLFVFDPRIIQNSILGITDPLYIFLTTFSIFLFLSNNKKIIYASFGLAALSALVRYEGILLVFVISIIFFVRYKKERNVVLKYLIAISIFVLVLMPMAYVRIQTTGENGLTNQIIAGGNAGFVITEHEKNKTVALFLYVLGGFVNLFKYLGWIMIPIFVFFVPSGAVLIFKNRNYKNHTIILSMILLSIPALYAYAREIQDTRYLYVLYPLFCILSIFTIGKLENKIKNRNTFLILIIGGILLSSSVYLEFKKFDYEHQREAFDMARHVVSIANGTNDYYPEDSYIVIANMPEKWPVLKSSISFKTDIIPTGGFNSLDDYIKESKTKGLTHLVLDGSKNRPNFLNDVFYHDEKYPYLVKVFESKDNEYKYHLKIYSIDYNKFDQHGR